MLPKDSLAGFLISSPKFWYFICFLVFLVLYKSIRSVKYYSKMTFYYSCILFLALLLLPYSMIRPFRPENYWPLVAVIPTITRYIFGLHVQVIDRHHLLSDKPFVLLLNHQSSLDAIVMFDVWPSRCVSLMKRELIKFFPFGTTAWLCGSIFIDRNNRDKALDTMAQAGNDLVKNNVKICMFPEGTRNRDGHMLPFKKGAFNLAVEAQVPLVPAVVSSYRHFYNAKEKMFGTGKIVITVLPPVSTEGLGKADVNDLTERIRNDMVEVFERRNQILGQGDKKSQ